MVCVCATDDKWRHHTDSAFTVVSADAVLTSGAYILSYTERCREGIVGSLLYVSRGFVGSTSEPCSLPPNPRLRTAMIKRRPPRTAWQEDDVRAACIYTLFALTVVTSVSL